MSSKRLRHILHELPHQVRPLWFNPRRRATGQQPRGYPRSLYGAQKRLGGDIVVGALRALRDDVHVIIPLAPFRALRRRRARLRLRHHPRVHPGHERRVRSGVGAYNRLAQGYEPPSQLRSVLGRQTTFHARGVDSRAPHRDPQRVQRVQVVIRERRYRAQHKRLRARRHQRREGHREPRVPRASHSLGGDDITDAGIRDAVLHFIGTLGSGRPSRELVDHPGQRE